MILGALCAVAAALAYGVASILQGVGARRSAGSSGASGLDTGALVRLATQLPYLAGTSLDGVAFVLSLVALQSLPLFFVQSLVASSIGVTAGIAAVMGAKLTGRQVASLIVLGLGLVLLAASAEPEAASPLSLTARWWVLALALPVAAVGVAAARSKGSRSPYWLAAVAGLGFSGVAIAARALELPHPVWRVVTDPALWAIVAHGLLAMTAFAMALQRGSVTTVTALTFAVDTVLPSLVGLAVLGDTWRPGSAVLAIAGFVLATAAALALAASGEPEVRRPTPAVRHNGPAPGGLA